MPRSISAPELTTAEKPAFVSRMRSTSALAIIPDWVIKAMLPLGRHLDPEARVDALVRRAIPIESGPIRRRPFARAASATARAVRPSTKRLSSSGAMRTAPHLRGVHLVQGFGDTALREGEHREVDRAGHLRRARVRAVFAHVAVLQFTGWSAIPCGAGRGAQVKAAAFGPFRWRRRRRCCGVERALDGGGHGGGGEPEGKLPDSVAKNGGPSHSTRGPVKL